MRLCISICIFAKQPAAVVQVKILSGLHSPTLDTPCSMNAMQNTTAAAGALGLAKHTAMPLH